MSDRIITQKILATVRGSLGTPFRAFGRDLRRGIDCIGLLTVPGQMHGLSLPTLERLTVFNGHKQVLKRALETDLDQIADSAAGPGDVVLIHIGGPGLPLHQHLALISDSHPYRVIHSTPFPIPEVVETELSTDMFSGIPRWWTVSVAGYFRFRTEPAARPLIVNPFD